MLPVVSGESTVARIGNYSCQTSCRKGLPLQQSVCVVARPYEQTPYAKKRNAYALCLPGCGLRARMFVAQSGSVFHAKAFVDLRRCLLILDLVESFVFVPLFEVRVT